MKSTWAGPTGLMNEPGAMPSLFWNCICRETTRLGGDGWRLENGRVMGTYLHGLLDAPLWRNEFPNRIRRGKGLPEMAAAADGRGGRFRQYDLLSDHFEKHVDVDAIMKAMGL